MKFLIVGLGNPGVEYVNTRHNIGFKVLDALSESSNTSFTEDRHAHYSSIKHKARTFHLIKPTTFMNLSGKAVKYWMQQENIKIQNILIISDDLNLPLGRIRLRPSGSSGGHNGLENIENVLNSNQYARLRIGISSPKDSFNQIDFVLGKFNNDEYEDGYELVDFHIMGGGITPKSQPIDIYIGKVFWGPSNGFDRIFPI